MTEANETPKANETCRHATFDFAKGRPDLAKANRMTDETAEYGQGWQAWLTAYALERARHGIFPREFSLSHSWDSLLTEISDDIIAKAREKKGTGPLIVLLGGGGAAGKSTFRKLIDQHVTPALQQKQSDGTSTKPVRELPLDQYFYPVELIQHREADGKYDNPLNSDLLRARKNVESLKAGHDVVIPVHDKDKHTLADQHCRPAPELKNARVVVVEGLYALGPCLRDLGDLAIYVHASSVDRGKGRIWRDINVRNRSEDHVLTMLLGREAYHQTFVEPTQMVSDYVVRRGHTVGKVAVLDRDVLEECIKNAGKLAGLDGDGVATLWKTFTNEERKHLEAEAAKTEW
jgi:uridine kinase